MPELNPSLKIREVEVHSNVSELFNSFVVNCQSAPPCTASEIGFIPKGSDKGHRWTDFLLRAAVMSRALWSRNRVSPIAGSSDLKECEQLLFREYRKKNLCERNSSERYFSPFTYLPTTTVLAARSKSKLFGTISVIKDSDIGLPMDSIYSEELEVYRNKGMKLVEFGALALDNSLFSRKAYSLRSTKKLLALGSLFTGAINYAYQFTEATHVVVVVDPRHADIYRYIGMEQFSDIRLYPRVNKKAVPFILDIEKFFAAATDHVPSLFAVSCMQVLERRRRYTPSTLDLVHRISQDIACAIHLSSCERQALAKSHSTIGPLLAELSQLPPSNIEENRNPSSTTMDGPIESYAALPR
jgi:hypothetical protein